MNRLCRKDVFRNRYAFPVLLVVNFVYISIHFLPEKMFYKAHTGCQAAYVLAVALLVPFLLFPRYGDENVSVLETVVYTRLRKAHRYNRCYLFWLLVVLLVPAVLAAAVSAFCAWGGILRGSLFAASILVLCLTLLQLFVCLVRLIHKFLFAFVAYVLCLLVLVLVNAPDSYLWFVYEPELGRLMAGHWAGKAGLLSAVTALDGVSLLCHRVGRQKNA
jgi:hypothetical protein